MKLNNFQEDKMSKFVSFLPKPAPNQLLSFGRRPR